MTKSDLAQTSEAVAYELMKDILTANNKPIGGGLTAKAAPTKEDIFQAFREAVDLVNLVYKG